MACEWHSAPLGELISYIGKGVAPKYINDGLDATMVLGQKCVRNQSLQYEQARFHNSAEKAVNPDKEVRKGDILINATGVGSAGRVAQVMADPSRQCITDGHVITLRAKDINPFYLGYFVKSKQKTIELMAEGSTGQTEMNRQRLQSEIIVTFPESKDLQKRIAEYGLAIDKKITVNNQLNDYLEQLVDGKFQELFGGLNFNATLSDVAEITMGQSPAGSSYNEEGAGIIFYQGRGEFGWRFPKRRLYTTEPKRLACEGDVLMSVRAPVGDLNVAFENCCIGRGLAAIHSETPSFALYLMRFLKPQLEAYNGEGTVFGSINGKALKSLEVALPSHNEVMQFESFAAPIDALIRSNENETRKLNNLRNYLLPKLMSGEIDVSKVDLTQLTNNHLLVRGHNVPNRYWKEHLWKPLLITFCRRCRTCLIRHSSNIWPKCSESHCCQFRKHQCRRIC